MGVKCKHYKLCSVQLLVYFSQFWGMKHFLGPVCDIRPKVKNQLIHGIFELFTARC